MKKALFILVLSLISVCLLANPETDQHLEDSRNQNTVNSAKLEPTFTFAGLDWLVGPNYISWSDAQAWINDLEGDWRAPTPRELKALTKDFSRYNNLWHSALLWSTDRGPSTAYYFSINQGVINHIAKGFQRNDMRVIAVRRSIKRR